MSEELDLSKIVDEVQQMLSSEDGQNQLQGMLEMLTGSATSTENTSDAGQKPSSSHASPFDLFSGAGDVGTLLKLKNIMDAVGNGANDSNAAFLQALKPFLREERRRKLDSAAKILTVTKALKAFKDSGIGGV